MAKKRSKTTTGKDRRKQTKRRTPGKLPAGQTGLSLSDQPDELQQFSELFDNTMFENYEKKILDLQNLVRITGLINSSLKMEDMTESLLYSCQGIILNSSIAIFLMRSVLSDEFKLTSYVGLEETDPEITVPFDTPLICKLRDNTTRSIFLDELSDEDRSADSDTLEKLLQLETELLIPMKNQEKLVGFLCFGRKLNLDRYTNTEVEFLTNVAQVAAIAAQNIQLFEMATMDRMTNLYVHHYFQNRLVEEIARSVRHGFHLALIMFDIDKFKAINDTWGHPAGDEVIKTIAEMIRENARKIDLPARYGGEEFAVILPGSDCNDAWHMAERIRKQIEEHPFQINIDGETIRLTISAGISEVRPEELPKDDGLIEGNIEDTPPELLLKNRLVQEADSALYHSKRNGRNTVTVYTPDLQR